MTTKIGTANDYLDLMHILDAFLTETGHAWGLRFTGAGNGRMRGHGGTRGGYIGTANSVTETITVTFTSGTSAEVSGSTSGPLGTATVGADFTSSKILFRLVAGTVAFQAGDEFTINTGPGWTRHRFCGSPEPNMKTGSFSDTAKLYDGNTTSGFVTATGYPQWTAAEMGTPTRVRSVAVWTYTVATSPKDLKLEYSDNGTTWTLAQAWAGLTFGSNYDRRTVVVDADPGKHKHWRITITAGAHASNLQVAQIRLFEDVEGLVDVSSRMEFAYTAPGVDGTQEIWMAGYTSATNATDTYNLIFRGFRFWQNRAISVLDVPDNSGGKVHPMAKTPMAYWIVVNGGRAIILTRISSVYLYSYIGFGLPYETPSVHPHPYICAAPAATSTYRWDATGNQMMRNPADPVWGSANSSAAAIFPNGIFEQIGNRNASSNSIDGATAPSSAAKVWPYAMDEVGNFLLNAFMRENIDGSLPLLPCVICYGIAPQHAWGEFDGVYWTTGFANTAEAIVRDGAIDAMAVPNVYRSGSNHFSAIALD